MSAFRTESPLEQNKTILLVEDNPDDVELTLLAFAQHDMEKQVVVAWDGQDALDYLFGTGPMPSVNIASCLR